MVKVLDDSGLSYFWGKIKTYVTGLGYYTKPTGGIPASDIASGVIPDISGKQDTLVSGTNIKTINNESLLGSGNITIQGGGAGTLDTTATTAQSINSSESLSGSVTLHKIAKTGTYGDLIDAPQYVICTLAEYNAMASHDSDTYYIILNNA